MHGGPFVRTASVAAAAAGLLGFPGCAAWVAPNPKHPRVAAAPGMISEQQLGYFEALETEAPPCERRVALLDYTAGEDDDPVGFETAWGYQKEILCDQIDRLAEGGETGSSFLPADPGNGTAPGRRGDTVLMLQHRPVYTLGTGSDEAFVKQASSSSSSTPDPPVPVVRMDRGGEVTYHGPGQITVYPILDLRSYRMDIHWYMRALEEAVILAISRCGSGLTAEREEGVTGVWIEDHKVAAVGIKCRRWITQHGLAVNVGEESLSNFGGIGPCGREGRRVGCLNGFLTARGEEPITVGAFAGLLGEALEEVFRIELVDQPLMR